MKFQCDYVRLWGTERREFDSTVAITSAAVTKDRQNSRWVHIPHDNSPVEAKAIKINGHFVKCLNCLVWYWSRRLHSCRFETRLNLVIRKFSTNSVMRVGKLEKRKLKHYRRGVRWLCCMLSGVENSFAEMLRAQVTRHIISLAELTFLIFDVSGLLVNIWAKMFARREIQRTNEIDCNKVSDTLIRSAGCSSPCWLKLFTSIVHCFMWFAIARWLEGRHQVY